MVASRRTLAVGLLAFGRVADEIGQRGLILRGQHPGGPLRNFPQLVFGLLDLASLQKRPPGGGLDIWTMRLVS